MTSLERIRCAARRQPVDRIPVAPYMGNHGAHVAGVPIGLYCRSGRIMAEAQFQAWRIYGQDAVVAQSDNYYIAEGFGVEVEHYDDATPTLRTPAVRELADIGRLRVPDPWTDGRMPVYLEAIRRLSEMTRGEVAVRAPGTGPFSLAGHLLGTESFLIELAMADREPGGPGEQSLKRLLELTTEALIAFATACLEAGAHHCSSRGFSRVPRHDLTRHLSQMGMADGTSVFRDHQSVGPAPRGGDAASHLWQHDPRA